VFEPSCAADVSVEGEGEHVLQVGLDPRRGDRLGDDRGRPLHAPRQQHRLRWGQKVAKGAAVPEEVAEVEEEALTEAAMPEEVEEAVQEVVQEAVPEAVVLEASAEEA
jgi:hypothetical protein